MLFTKTKHEQYYVFVKLNFVLQDFLTIVIILQEIMVTKTHWEENHLGRCFMIHVGDQDWSQVRYARVPIL